MAKVQTGRVKLELPPLPKESSSSESVSDVQWSESDLSILADNCGQAMSVKEPVPKRERSSYVCPRMKFDSWTRTEPIKLPHLNKRELNKRTLPPKHNFCVDLLKDGFPNTFVGFFNIVKEFDSKKKDSNLDTDRNITLGKTNEKFENLAKYLSKAEDAERKRHWVDVYHAKKFLATYFQEEGDQWLTHHFFIDCLKVAKKIKGDGGKILAEAHGFMGLYYDYLGNLEKAAEHFRVMYKMSDKQNWQNIHYKPMHAEASFYIAKVYSSMADSKIEGGLVGDAIKLYLKALKMSKTANDRPMTISVYLKLGRMYMNRNELAESMSCYHHVEKVCKEIGEFKSLCLTYQEMAQVCTLSGKDEEAREYIKKFAYTAERHNLSDELIKASFLLGVVSSSKYQNYELAWRSFSKSFEVAQRLERVTLGDSVRVQCGIALANHVVGKYTKKVKSDKIKTVTTIIQWKLTGKSQFLS